MNEETKPPEGLELAETMCGHAFCADACTEDQMRAAIDAIRAEHAQRLTLQHHAADMAQRVADLETRRDSYKAAFAEWMQLADYMRDLVRDGTAPADSLGHHCANAAIETIKRLIRQRDELNHQHHAVRADAQARVDAVVIRALAAEKDRDECRQLASAYSPARELAASLKQAKASGDAARKERDELRARLAEERNTARGAVKGLEAKVFSQEQTLDVLRTCVARHQRDEADPPGYLQDAVIRAAGLGALHAERDELRMQVHIVTSERDELASGMQALRARLAEMERQEPVATAWITGGRMVSAFNHPPRSDFDPDERWAEIGYSQAPLYARPVPAAPKDWKLVPVKPTREQWVAGGTAAREYMEETGRNNPAVIYAAMLTAAPEHKA